MRSPAGFTLIETLVSLVVISLLGTMIFQVISHFALVQGRVLERGQYSIELNRAEFWFRETLQSGVPAMVATDQDYEGTVERFKLTTISPLATSSGTPRTISWRIEDKGNDRDLIYSEAGAGEWAVLRGLDRQYSRFEYVDNKGAGHELWPVNEQPDLLLSGVRLVSMQDGGDEMINWFVSLDQLGLGWIVYED